MIVIGLTGSLGMGKSTAAMLLRSLGVPVHDADQAVHRLLAPGGAAVAAVAKAFPGSKAKQGGIDRKALGTRVFHDRAAMARLERILHPLVRASEERFFRHQRALGAKLVALDIPLLFETGAEGRVDVTLVVSAPPFLQRARVLARPGMTEDRFRAVLAQQMPDSEKRRRADFIVPNGLGRAATRKSLAAVLRLLKDSCVPEST